MEQLSNVLPAVFGELIPLSAIVLGIGIAFWAMYLGHQRRRMQFEERRLMIEKGMTPPPMSLESRKGNPQSCLRTGIILVSLGVGFAIAFVIRQGGNIFADVRGPANGFLIASSILLPLGIGYLIYYAIAKKQAPPPSLPPTMQ